MRNEMLHVSNLVLSALTALVLMAGVAAESRAQTPPGPDRDATRSDRPRLPARESRDHRRGHRASPDEAARRRAGPSASRHPGERRSAPGAPDVARPPAMRTAMSPWSSSSTTSAAIASVRWGRWRHCWRLMRMCGSSGKSSRSWAPSRASPPARPAPTKHRLHALLLGPALVHELRQAIALLKLNPIPCHVRLPNCSPTWNYTDRTGSLDELRT